ncbi:putative alpha-ketoglutarate-dependent dioxygenase alkB-like 7, mitochondrial [Apostichopus japonicus]|uniref:Putative alpha-ketoglutarate-dependent dioxygenase alkB-like 7, mitochondrial n=1 Tax=Stichopus japonicus TaxID=307972 RepID=A0A2G8JUV0_STIJA|nr:putative alpha-ketoglutarate-dependent dioxygenase alkB-like 7, mitochondrial [Apostichopus japonicus]
MSRAMLTSKLKRSLLRLHSRTFAKTSRLNTDRPGPISTLNPPIEYSCDNIAGVAKDNFCVIPNFISDEEETVLLKEIDKHFRGIRYEYDHWDNAVHGYRETEKSKWSLATENILQRVRDAAFTKGATQLPLVHVLDLAANGYIKAHVDSVKFCGPTIAGLSLISPSVLRLVKEDDSTLWLKAVLPAGSLYIMRNQIRFDYTHEILRDEDSYIRDVKVNKGRRVSVMSCDQPVEDHS